MELSIVIPAYNEEENIARLHSALVPVLDTLNKKYEIIFIDDGSTDHTYPELLKLNKKDKNVKVIKFRKNFGQTPAWSAGFNQAEGELVIVMDADLQNDPRDIPRLIEKLNEGYDVVSGWRYKRKDTFSKRIFSKFANKLRKTLTGERIHDSGCSLKVYKKECIKSISLFGEMHRYITAILSWKGYRVGELKVMHNPRRFGKTKYSFSRVFRGMLDLLIVTFWQKYSARPIHIFGLSGFVSALLGTIAGLISVYLRIFQNVDLSDTFLPNVAVFLVIMGINLLLFGIIADICVKIYYKEEKPYLIEKIVE